MNIEITCQRINLIVNSPHYIQFIFKERKGKVFIKNPWLLIFFVISSLAILLFGQSYNKTKIIEVNPTSVRVDRITNNLISTYKNYKEYEDEFLCIIDNSSNQSFCKINLFLSDNISEGIDLSNYKYISFDIGNINESGEYIDGSDNFNIYLRNFNNSYSTQNNIRSLKINGAFINKINEVTYKNVPLQNFHLNDDWIEEFNIPHNEINTDLSNVSLIQIKTGSNLEEGSYKIKIKSISFKGDWINDRKLMLFLVFKWMMISLSYAVTFIYRESKRADLFEGRNTRLKSSTKKIIEEYKKDPLTGIYNRHAFRQWLIYNKEDFVLSVIYMDLDHFKNINDIHGHKMGDTILCEFTKLVNSISTEDDIFCRWGGEEFVLFCKGKQVDYGIEKIKNIQNEMKLFKWSHGKKLTISAGLSTGKSTNINELLELADKALYEAKNTGRNKYEISN